MKPEVKKWLIVGSLGVISVALALGYLQYKKLMNYTIKLKALKIKNLSAKLINFDLFINFTNNSDLQFVISDQDYKVFLNDKFVSKISNPNDTIIAPKSTSVLPINIGFNPTDVLNLLGKNLTTILIAPETINLRVEIKLKVAIYGIKVSIPYIYTATLKEIMSKNKEEK